MSYAGFNSVQLKRPQVSKFDLTHDRRLSTRMGRLTPCFMTECVPSDRFTGGSEILLRLAPLLAPIYDQISLYVHYFFVPNRLLWEEWDTFITGGRLGVGIDPVLAPAQPTLEIGGVLNSGGLTQFDNGSLADYLGVPNFLTIDSTPASWNNRYIDAMPFAAYQLVWMEYYRDRNFVPDTYFALAMPLPSGNLSNTNAIAYTNLHSRNYLHDYFTSALPFTQRGEEVLMPVSLGGIAPLYSNLTGVGAGTSWVASGIGQPGSIAIALGTETDNSVGEDGTLYVKGEDFDGTSTSINDFRSAYALQVWLERNAIGGSRYTESTQAHFGVNPQDSRLQRPEYIGGGKINVKISEVVSTAWATDETDTIPQGNMAGHGVSYGNTNRFNYFCVEHGFIIGIASVMAPPSYQQGLPRMFRRASFLDYPWPTFAKLGEQTVNDFEIYCTPAALLKDADGVYPTFGYQSRYADWKYIPTTNHADFRSSLLFWTLTRTFSTAPVLSAEFNIFQDDTQDRIFAVADVDNFWLYVHNSVQVIRPLPYFGTPNTLGFS